MDNKYKEYEHQHLYKSVGGWFLILYALAAFLVIGVGGLLLVTSSHVSALGALLGLGLLIWAGKIIVALVKQL